MHINILSEFDLNIIYFKRFYLKNIEFFKICIKITYIGLLFKIFDL